MKKLLFLLIILTSFGLYAQGFDHSAWDKFLKKHVSLNGDVDYRAIKTNETELAKYIHQFSKTAPAESWGKEEKLAYWINAYNAFTIKLIIDNYPLKSIKDIRNPWDKKFIPVAGKLISLNHIEHDILRKMNEPRIHFAINCASVSCPKLWDEAFTPNTLEAQLTKAAKDFINDPSKNKISASDIEISKIFNWFKKDFEKNGTVIDFLNRHSETKISSKAKVSYLKYDWNLNGK